MRFLLFIQISLFFINHGVSITLGFSFFTFMAITYPFDIYRGKMSHTRNFLDFALFVAFFPTVVSGPVERASHMLPQFQSIRQVTSEKVNEGLWLIAWGFFQNMVIADNVGLTRSLITIHSIMVWTSSSLF